MASYQSFRGDTFEISSQWIINSIPQSLDGYSVTFTVKRHYQDNDLLSVFQGSTTDSSVVITDSINGKVTATMPAISTIQFPDGITTLVYDFQAKHTSSGKIKTIESGTIDIIPDVTRSI